MFSTLVPVLWNRKDLLWNCNYLLRLRFQLWEKLGSGFGSGSVQYLAQFQTNKNCTKSSLFNVRSSIIWPLIFDFFNFFIPFHVGSGSKSGSGTGTGTVMHSGSGSTKAKSYGSSSSGFGSTTLLNTFIHPGKKIS
jgi:hypothetical protein